MDTMTFTDVQQSLGDALALVDVMDRVIRDRVEVVVTRDGREAVVMMSLDAYTTILSAISDGKGANAKISGEKSASETTALEQYNLSFQAARRGA